MEAENTRTSSQPIDGRRACASSPDRQRDPDRPAGSILPAHGVAGDHDPARGLARRGYRRTRPADPLVYDHLRKLARSYTRREQGNVRQEATALVHDAFVRLVNARAVDWRDRVHFFAVAARIMRRTLVDVARARAAAKRGGAVQRSDHSRWSTSTRCRPNAANAPTNCACSTTHFALAVLDPRLSGRRAATRRRRSPWLSIAGGVSRLRAGRCQLATSSARRGTSPRGAARTPGQAPPVCS